MNVNVRTKAKVLAGNRLELHVPQFSEGQTVEVIVLPGKAEDGRGSLLSWLDSLPPGPRSFDTWEEVDRNFHEERDAWDR